MQIFNGRHGLKSFLAQAPSKKAGKKATTAAPKKGGPAKVAKVSSHAR